MLLLANRQQAAMESTLERNPHAFRPKITHLGEGGSTDTASPLSRHMRGCHCKKSGCLKKYCECFQASFSRPPAPPPCRCIKHSAILPSNRDANHCKCCRARQFMNIQSDHPHVSSRGTMSARLLSVFLAKRSIIPPLQASIMCSDLNLGSWGVSEF
jgi:hypothetical protein